MTEWLESWRRDGVVLGDSTTLIPADLFQALQADAQRVMTDKFAKLQAHLETKDRPEAKKFLKQWLGRFPRYEPSSPWAEIARLLAPLATAYLESPAVLRFYNLWETIPIPGGPQRSQLWHTDPEDRVIAKAFLYLSDVTERAGPLVYATGTHAYGRYADKKAETFREEGSGWLRSTDFQMSKLVPPEQWRTATGPIGTLVLADTAGYHKGGYCVDTTRLLATWEFTTANAVMDPRFDPMGAQP